MSARRGAQFVPIGMPIICWKTLLWSLPLPNVTWHSGTWPYTMTPSVDQTLHQFANLLPNWTLIPNLTLLPNFGGFHRTLQRVRLANRRRLLLRTPGPVPFGNNYSKCIVNMYIVIPFFLPFCLYQFFSLSATFIPFDQMIRVIYCFCPVCQSLCLLLMLTFITWWLLNYLALTLTTVTHQWRSSAPKSGGAQTFFKKSGKQKKRSQRCKCARYGYCR